MKITTLAPDASGLVEWGAQRSIGFSAVVSLGDAMDVDFGDLLDWFAQDAKTRAILLYIESIHDARKFVSAARAAARAKPVVVVKSGRHAQGAKAAATHTGALAGSDAVYDAAIARAGMLRVNSLQELFLAAETLARFRTNRSESLTILTNGGGAGVMAADAAAQVNVPLTELGASTLAQRARMKCRLRAPRRRVISARGQWLGRQGSKRRSRASSFRPKIDSTAARCSQAALPVYQLQPPRPT